MNETLLLCIGNCPWGIKKCLTFTKRVVNQQRNRRCMKKSIDGMIVFGERHKKDLISYIQTIEEAIFASKIDAYNIF